MHRRKPTLRDLRARSALSAAELARAAGVPLRVVYLAEIGGVVSQDEAARVLLAFSCLLGRPVTFRDVYMNVRCADEETRPLPILRASRIRAWRRTHALSEQRAGVQSPGHVV